VPIFLVKASEMVVSIKFRD